MFDLQLGCCLCGVAFVRFRIGSKLHLRQDYMCLGFKGLGKCRVMYVTVKHALVTAGMSLSAAAMALVARARSQSV